MSTKPQGFTFQNTVNFINMFVSNLIFSVEMWKSLKIYNLQHD